MANLVKIQCVNNNSTSDVEMGTSLVELAEQLGLKGEHPFLAAFVNHKLKELNYKVYTPAKVEFFDITHLAGFRVYQRSLIFIMQAVISKLYPSQRFHARHAIGDSIYCEVEGKSEFSTKECQALYDKACEIVRANLPITREKLPTEEVVAEYATYFNRIGELTAERGMQFCYHPRQQELKVTDGKSIFEAIVANTDPEKVHFEIDTYEAVEAGVDVNELLKKLTKRVTLLHIHDYGIIGESQKIDFEKIIAEGIRTGVKDIFVEVRNFSLPPMNCIERSIYNVESLPSISY